MTPSTRTRTKRRSLLRREVDVGGAEIEGLRDGSVDEDDGRACRGCRSRTLASSSVSAALRHDLLDGDQRRRRSAARSRASIASGAATQMRTGMPTASRSSSENIDVGRVGDGDEHAPVVEEADRERHVAAGQALRAAADAAAMSIEGDVELDELELVLLGEHPGDRTPVCEAVRRARISPSRSSGWRRFAARGRSRVALASRAPSRTSSVPRAGHWFLGFLTASIATPYRQVGSTWLRDRRYADRRKSRDCGRCEPSSSG